MAEKAENKVKNRQGRGFMGRVFKLKRYMLRVFKLRRYTLRKSYVHALPLKPSKYVQSEQSKIESNRASIHESKASRELNSNQKPARKSTSWRPSDNARSSTTSSSGNILVNNSPRISNKNLECVAKNTALNYMLNSYNAAVMGNIVRKNSDRLAQSPSPSDKLAQSPSPRNRVDPEVLKSMGNEIYKQGRFEEALGLYDQAIAVDSSKATYRFNKSATLMSLGRLLEAIVECEEAIRLEPSYDKAHHRLAKIYLRLGEAEKALNCNHTTPYPDSALDFQAQALQNHLDKCITARKVNEWNVVLKETQSAMSLGADSAPQLYALQTEALLKLMRHQEAYATHEKRPKFGLNWCIKLFGPTGSAYLLMVGAQVYLAACRFEDAVTSAQQAANLDPSNKEVNAVVRRARAVASARMSGNLIFKAPKFTEACAVHNEGLEHDPHNSILPCNIAACRSKLGQFEKAIEDCNAAPTVQPSYSKARLGGADCNAEHNLRWILKTTPT